MKNSVCLFLLFFFFSHSRAQQVSFGPSAGLGHSFFRYKDDMGLESKFHTSYNLGVILGYKLNSHWLITGGVNFSREGGTVGQRVMNDQNEYIYRLNYIRVPLNAQYIFGNPSEIYRPFVSLGPSMGFLTGGRSNSEVNGEAWESATSTDLFTSLDVGMNVSAGMRVRTGKESYLNGAFNYYHGFSNIFESAPIEIRNRAIGIEFAIFFPVPRIN